MTLVLAGRSRGSNGPVTRYNMKCHSITIPGVPKYFAYSRRHKEFLDKYELRKILDKYCAFLPVEIYLKDLEEEEKAAAEASKKDKKDGKEEEEQPKPLMTPIPFG